MSNLFITLIVAFIVIVLAIACMAIGWLITGKSKIVRGACGMKPEELRKNKCGTKTQTCSLCTPELTEEDRKKNRMKKEDEESEEI